MHFNFHLSGDESPEQSRRIANAVLALGGLLGAKTDIVQTHVIRTGELSPELRQALKGGASANVSVGYRSESTRVAECAAIDLARSSEPQLTEDDLPLNPPPYVEGEQFTGGLTTSAAETKTPATDRNGLPWDERIHSSSRAINADGTWRYRKNVPDETKQDVEAELSALMKQARALVKEPDDLLAVDDATLARLKGNAGDSYGDASKHSVVAPPVPVPLTPPAPPVPTGALQRTYSDVVNLIMARKVQPDTYVAILGMSLPEFAKHVISAPNDATLMFDALDQASRSA